MERSITKESNAARSVVPRREYVVDLFDGLAPRYDGVLRAYTLGQDLRWKDVLIRRLHPVAGERILDLACGTGLILERLSNLVGASNVVGADLTKAMLLELGRRRGAYPVVQADAERLPFKSGSFDVVTAGYLLKYVRFDRFLPELRRVLRPNGRFGSYDFSRPIHGTLSGALYSIYLHRFLPAIGGAPRTRGSRWRSVFGFLSRLSETSGWEERVEEGLAQAGFGSVEIVPTSGGAVTWVWARRS